MISLLVKNHLLPISNGLAGETFLVEFRLSSQRYQLWLNRAQKADLEKLLMGFASAQRKTDILTVYQQEQARFFAAYPRPTAPQAPQQHPIQPAQQPLQQQQIRFVRPPPTTAAAAASASPGHQTLPSGQPMCLLTSVAPRSVAVNANGPQGLASGSPGGFLLTQCTK